MEINNIKKNSNQFSFVDKLGSFINNMQFTRGFNEFKEGKNSQKAYIWNALSSLAGDYGEVIYENVLNYVDNVSNIDLCKIKALQSMMNIIGVKYDVLNTFADIPVEIANLMDILSINKHYLTDSTVFKQEFIDSLSAENIIIESTTQNDLSNELCSSTFKSVDLKKIIVDDGEYEDFLKRTYLSVLNNFVFLKYADKENGLSTTGTYIYEYIKKQLLNTQIDYNYNTMSQYDAEISKLKIKYNIDKSFDQSQIVDDIECMYDSISNYNIYEQKILQKEIEKRCQPYTSTMTTGEQKPYLSSDKGLGYNLTRYSYYREKKVKEYFKFIENTYNNLLTENQVIESLANNDEKITISSYEKDENYFRIDQNATQYLLEIDENDELRIKKEYITQIAALLAKQTLEIADIREQIKIQIRKSYLRGTFLLVSYIVNEFLKYNVLDKYGSYLSQSLSTILSKSLNSGSNVKLIEYYDETEYFNISSQTYATPKNYDKVNEKFWDNPYDKVGEITEDIPLDEIEEFYLRQMKLERRDVSNLANFLSIVYEYGANNSFINNATDEFTCQLHDGRFIGDPYNAISAISVEILSVETIKADAQTYIDDGFPLSSAVISSQLIDLSGWLSSYYYDKITSFNKDTIDGYKDEYEEKLNDLEEIQSSFNEVSARFEELVDNKRYLPYYSRSSFDFTGMYFIEKLNNFYLSATKHDISWDTNALKNDLQDRYKNYMDLRDAYLTCFIQKNIWDNNSSPDHEYWKYYSYDYEAEITSQTTHLRNYLTEKEAEAKADAQQHLQNHYDKLLSYKSELGQVLDDCINAYAKLDSYYAAVEVGTGFKLSEDLTAKYCVWDGPYFKKKTTFVYDKNSDWWDVSYDDTDVKFYGYHVEYEYSKSVSRDGSIRSILDGLESRCNFKTYLTGSNRKTLEPKNIDPSHPELAGGFDTEVGACEYIIQKVKYWTYEEIVDYTEKGKPITEKRYASAEYLIPHYPESFPTKYARDPESEQHKWQAYYSKDLRDEIIHTFEAAISKLKTIVALINSEVKCYGGSEIILGALTIDTVKKETENAFNKLAGKDNILDSLDNYIKKPDGWKDLAGLASANRDQNLLVFKNRLTRIEAVNDENIKTSKDYNIRYFDTNFYKQFYELQDLLKLCADYFDEYTHNETLRLDKQIENMSSYMLSRNAQCSAEVVSTCLDISSQYFEIINVDYAQFYPGIKREEVIEVNDDYSYQISVVLYIDETYSQISSYESTSYHVKYKDYLDYLLSGDYINDAHSERLSGMVYWLSEKAPEHLSSSENAAVYAKIPNLNEYKTTMHYIDLMFGKYLLNYLSCEEKFNTKLQYVIELYKDDIAYISSQISVYEKNYEIYLKYNGTDIGYDPFYNHKNVTYSSYQIHPYLYNFVEKLDIEYPLADSFFVAFTEEYEKDLVKIGLDNIIGKYGNPINKWKYQLYDFTSYESKYEAYSYKQGRTPNNYNPMVGFTGAFYPPALKAYLEDTQKFIQDVEDNNEQSYYYHLNLTNSQLEKIVKQLTEYEQPIREIANSHEKTLSSEYDIYKFAEDQFGNSLILFKSYKHLYEQNKDTDNYVPTYNQKKNTPGELWMRLKDHPIAFPAFDLRESFDDISQYNIKEKPNSSALELNTYVLSANAYFMNSSNLSAITEDTIGKITTIKQKQNLRCFFDMELEPMNRGLMLVVPMYTGTNSQNKKHNNLDLMTYANSSIIVGMLSYDDYTDIYSYSVDENIELGTAIDNIHNPGYLYTNSTGYVTTTCSTKTLRYEFVGFVTNNRYTFALFVMKYISTNSFTDTSSRVKNKPYLVMMYSGYRTQCTLITDRQTTSGQLKYDIFSNKVETSPYNDDKYKYANTVVCTSTTGTITLAFASKRVQNTNYDDNSTIVNFAEYTTMCEDKITDGEYGLNKSYPRETAMIQSDDASRINIYNSFDSFVQHLVNVKFTFIGNSIYSTEESYFNLNSDLGFNPQYADEYGKTRYYNNPVLSSLSKFNIELLGPENSDLPYTPVIVDHENDEKNGRVTEDYREVEEYNYNVSNKLSILRNEKYVSYTFQLSNILSSEYDNDDDQTVFQKMFSTGEIRNYKYILFNNKYQSIPILKGDLSDVFPKQNTYQGSEYFDLISGDEIIGPNSTTYQNVSMSNHINNIKKINVEVGFDPIHYLPINMTMSCIVNQPQDYVQTIDENQFQMHVYIKNSYKTYEFFHIIQNPWKGLSDEFSQDDTYDIDFNKISGELSDFQMPDGRYPFRKSDASDGKHPKELSAHLAFKYSETDDIDREFPIVGANDVQDEIITLSNDSRYIYFVALDNHNTISTDIIRMKTYVPGDGGSKSHYATKTINYSLPKYRDFLDRALTLQTTYNMEKVVDSKDCEDYNVVLYFNYKNYTSPQYIDILYPTDLSSAPSAIVSKSTDDNIKNTYLALKPGESGKLDIRLDFVDYKRFLSTDITYHIAGKETVILNSYYIMNVSDSKPKFIIQRKSFAADDAIIDEDNYEIDEDYNNATFRYVRLKISGNRGGKYVGFSRLFFCRKSIDQWNDFFEYPAGSTIEVTGTETVAPNYPENIMNQKDPASTEFIDRPCEFLGSNVKFTIEPVVMIIDLKSRCLNIDEYKMWGWSNNHNSYSHSGNIPKTFTLDFSNDGVRWWRGDECYNTEGLSLPTNNNSIAYRHTIDVKNVAF